MVLSLQPLNRKVSIMTVLTNDIILDREHAAIMEHCEAVTRRPSQRRKPQRATRSEASRLAEYEAQLWATSINMINFSSTPWS